MKIIGVISRAQGVHDRTQYICEVDGDEVAALIDEFRSYDSQRLPVGTNINVTAMAKQCREMRDTKTNLSNTPKVLRALADVLDRECAPLNQPAEQTTDTKGTPS